MLEETYAEERARGLKIGSIVEALEVEMRHVSSEKEARVASLEGELQAARTDAARAVVLEREVGQLRAEKNGLAELTAASQTNQEVMDDRIKAQEKSLVESKGTTASLRSSLAAVREELQRTQAELEGQRERGRAAEAELREVRGMAAALQEVNRRHDGELDKRTGGAKQHPWYLARTRGLHAHPPARVDMTALFDSAIVRPVLRRFTS